MSELLSLNLFTDLFDEQQAKEQAKEGEKKNTKAALVHADSLNSTATAAADKDVAMKADVTAAKVLSPGTAPTVKAVAVVVGSPVSKPGDIPTAKAVTRRSARGCAAGEKRYADDQTKSVRSSASLA